MHPLDDPVRSALTGPHAHLAQRHGSALRYPPEVSAWAAFADDADGWRDAAGIGDPVVVVGAPLPGRHRGVDDGRAPPSSPCTCAASRPRDQRGSDRSTDIRMSSCQLPSWYSASRSRPSTTNPHLS